MCNNYSCVLKKNYEVLDSLVSDSHEDIVALHKLIDNDIGKNREWIRCEVIPKISLNSSNPDEWEYRLDDSGDMPDWYNSILAEQVCKEKLIERIKEGRYEGRWKGDVYVSGTFTAPKLTKVDGSVYVYVSGTFTAPKLTKVDGSVYVYGTFTAPKLTKVDGSVSVSGTFTAQAGAINRAFFFTLTSSAC